METLADWASFYGNRLILEQIKNKSQVLPLLSLLTQAINSDSSECVGVVKKMMLKNGINVTGDLIQTAQDRGVTKIIETLTDVPYDAKHEKENVRRRILAGDDITIGGR